jgi:NitT/TauT family transport system permease protein
MAWDRTDARAERGEGRPERGDRAAVRGGHGGESDDHAGLVRWSERRVRRWWPPAALFVAVVGAWHLAAARSGVPTVVFPSPLDVGRALVANAHVLGRDAAVTGLTAGLGLLGGTVAGVLLAFGMTQSRTFDALAHPYLVALRIAPLVAIAPMLFLWFGRGVGPRALLVTTITVFPVTVSSLGGLRAVPREYLDVARSAGAPERQVFFRIRVPAAAPSVFAGVKLAAALSVVGAVVAEFVTLSAGLGYRVFVSSTNLQTARAYAALFVLAVLGVAFYGVPAYLERRVQW